MKSCRKYVCKRWGMVLCWGILVLMGFAAGCNDTKTERIFNAAFHTDHLAADITDGTVSWCHNQCMFHKCMLMTGGVFELSGRNVEPVVTSMMNETDHCDTGTRHQCMRASGGGEGACGEHLRTLHLEIAHHSTDLSETALDDNVHAPEICYEDDGGGGDIGRSHWFDKRRRSLLSSSVTHKHQDKIRSSILRQVRQFDYTHCEEAKQMDAEDGAVGTCTRAIVSLGMHRCESEACQCDTAECTTTAEKCGCSILSED